MFLLLFFLMMMRMTGKMFVMMFLLPLLLMTILMKMTGRNSIKNTREVRVVFALHPSLECWNYLTIVLISYRIIKQWELVVAESSGSYLWFMMTDCVINTRPRIRPTIATALCSPTPRWEQKNRNIYLVKANNTIGIQPLRIHLLIIHT